MHYNELRERQQKEINSILNKYAFFAFNEDQFREGLDKLNATEADLRQIPGGGYILKDHGEELYNAAKRAHEEIRAAMNNKDFAVSAFRAELRNHEYSYTNDPGEAIEALGYSAEDIESNSMLKEALATACRLEGEEE